MKIYLPSTFILKYVGAKMILHAFMIELDQLNYWSKKFKNFENLCTKSMECCSLVVSQILTEFRPEAGEWNGSSLGIAQNTFIWILKYNMKLAYWEDKSIDSPSSLNGSLSWMMRVAQARRLPRPSLVFLSSSEHCSARLRASRT